MQTNFVRLLKLRRVLCKLFRLKIIKYLMNKTWRFKSSSGAWRRDEVREPRMRGRTGEVEKLSRNNIDFVISPTFSLFVLFSHYNNLSNFLNPQTTQKTKAPRKEEKVATWLYSYTPQTTFDSPPATLHQTFSIWNQFRSVEVELSEWAKFCGCELILHFECK